jgi:hypothetical protein
MKEMIGDMFSNKIASHFDAICITTNGIVKKDGKSVMGAGVAKQARDRFCNIDKILGSVITLNGNIVQLIYKMSVPLLYNKIHIVHIISFPTKNDWRQMSDLRLIEKSVIQLVTLTDTYGWNKILLPRPGCANGGRKWLSEVKPILKKYLDDRFYIIRRK